MQRYLINDNYNYDSTRTLLGVICGTLAWATAKANNGQAVHSTPAIGNSIDVSNTLRHQHTPVIAWCMLWQPLCSLLWNATLWGTKMQNLCEVTELVASLAFIQDSLASLNEALTLSSSSSSSAKLYRRKVMCLSHLGRQAEAREGERCIQAS